VSPSPRTLVEPVIASVMPNASVPTLEEPVIAPVMPNASVPVLSKNGNPSRARPSVHSCLSRVNVNVAASMPATALDLVGHAPAIPSDSALMAEAALFLVRLRPVDAPAPLLLRLLSRRRLCLPHI
jgi:hypothetical protein